MVGKVYKGQGIGNLLLKMEKVMDKIERWKLLAELFVKQNNKVFIREINGDLHFCIIVNKEEDFIMIENFGPDQRAGVREKIYWLSVSEFGEYKDRGVENG